MAQAPIRLLLAACQYPALLLDDDLGNGAGEPGPAYRALRRMAAYARERPPAAVVWTGDRIYVDATGGLFDPAVTTGSDVQQLDHALYRAYRDAALRPGWPDVCNHRMVHTIDDHEIGDNWEPSLNPERNRLLLEMARVGRRKFLRERWPGIPSSSIDTTALWSEEVLASPTGTTDPGSAAAHWGLFAADTRTERSARDPQAILQAEFMQGAQRAAFERWLVRDPQNRFIVTPGMLLPRHLQIAEPDAPAAACAPNRHGLAHLNAPARAALALRSDAWDGYPGALYALLALLADRQVNGCIFLSGDEHLACFADITVQPLHSGLPPVRLTSLHTGAMYAPYPFANGEPEDFAAEEAFEFDAPRGAQGRRYRCTVKARFAAGAGDGFTEVHIDASGHASACFRGERGELRWSPGARNGGG